MAERSGIAAQLGLATEETYGTYKAPSTFLPFDSESLVLNKTYIEDQALRAGRLALSKDLHVGTTKGGGGDVNLPFFRSSMGKLFNLFTGETVTPASISESEGKKATFKFGISSPFGKSATVQVGRPDVGGTVRAFSYLGCKGLSATIQIAKGGLATCTFSLDARDETTAESLGSATYSTSVLPFNWTQVVAKFGSEATNVNSLTLKLEVPQATDRYTLGATALKKEPIANNLVLVSADAELEFASLADHERFTKEEVVALEAIATGAEIDAKANYKATFTAAAAKQVSSGPTVQGPDILKQSVSFKCLDDGTNPALKLETISKDSAL